jgi:hypothetical protein
VNEECIFRHTLAPLILYLSSFLFVCLAAIKITGDTLPPRLFSAGFGRKNNIVFLFVVLLSRVIFNGVLMLSGHRETLSERGKKQENTKKWDRVLLPMYVLLAYFGIYLMAGLGKRFYWDRLPMECFYAGTALYLLSCIFTVWLVSLYPKNIANKWALPLLKITTPAVQPIRTAGGLYFFTNGCK